MENHGKASRTNKTLGNYVINMAVTLKQELPATPHLCSNIQSNNRAHIDRLSSWRPRVRTGTQESVYCLPNKLLHSVQI